MLKNFRSQTYRVASRPTLDEVLKNTAPPPYTLSAFISYLTQNHCLETLEFILEAERYRENFRSLVDPAKDFIVTTNCPTSSDLGLLYQIILNTYISPGADREVNLPVNVRDDLLQNKLENISTPPSPETLDLAVKSIHDLMEDSIFVSFLNSTSTYLYEDKTPMKSTQSSRSYHLWKTDIQPMEPEQTKRPSLLAIGKYWSWPPWTR
ncbi:hypothetical protein N7533_013053 [Penicillium manginii]|jgi:hypothetical protein|uniref:uncharacterized protein n=1 Tax=Penicillium manginii TaxID=203109 RepID=UPI0025486A86|nr:uncharacterized protein N7533_013053 [Penicillium manginii]KAJ5734650.1 hypothetical protein N7533_013053 [Penicillium manginii]